MFFWNSLAFSMIQQMLEIWPVVPLPFLNPAYTSRFLYLLKSNLEDFEHYVANVWNECNCAVVWAFFGTAFLWYWNENWPFPVLWPLLSFPNLLAYGMQHFHSIIFQDLKQLNWNSITSTNFVCSDAFQGPLDFTFQNVWPYVNDHPVIIIWVVKIFWVQFLCILATFS